MRNLLLGTLLFATTSGVYAQAQVKVGYSGKSYTNSGINNYVNGAELNVGTSDEDLKSYGAGIRGIFGAGISKEITNLNLGVGARIRIAESLTYHASLIADHMTLKQTDASRFDPLIIKNFQRSLALELRNEISYSIGKQVEVSVFADLDMFNGARNLHIVRYQGANEILEDDIITPEKMKQEKFGSTERIRQWGQDYMNQNGPQTAHEIETAWEQARKQLSRTGVGLSIKINLTK